LRGEKYWGAGTWEDIRGVITLPGDAVLEGYNSWSGGFNLNGHRLTIGEGGIVIHENAGVPKIYGRGSLTSSESNLNFILKNTYNLYDGYVVQSKITNDNGRKVGLSISGGVRGNRSHIDLVGSESNTFTGDIYISGYAGLQLYKTNGATAIMSDIYVSENGYLAISFSNQINDASKVRLTGRGGDSATLWFSHFASPSISEKIHRLEVEGNGILRYQSTRVGYLYLDDLEVFLNSKITIRDWSLGSDYLLVKKSSKHLFDSLNRIKFEGHWEWKAAVKDYNWEYWQLIPGIPEPSTYGAIFGGVGLVFYRRSKRIGRRILGLKFVP